jgi:hypothetical protein
MRTTRPGRLAAVKTKAIQKGRNALALLPFFLKSIKPLPRIGKGSSVLPAAQALRPFPRPSKTGTAIAAAAYFQAFSPAAFFPAILP